MQCHKFSFLFDRLRQLSPRVGLYMIFVIGALSGCSGGVEKSIIQSWVGSDINAVVSKWGPPQGEQEFSGRKYYSWGHSQSFNLPSQTTGTATLTGNTVQYSGITTGGVISGNCTRTLEVNENDIVIAGTSRGNNCCVMAVAGYCASLSK